MLTVFGYHKETSRIGSKTNVLIPSLLLGMWRRLKTRPDKLGELNEGLEARRLTEFISR